MNFNVCLHNKPVYSDHCENILLEDLPKVQSDSADANPVFWGECVTMKYDNAKFMITLADGGTKFLDTSGNFYVIANVSSDKDVVDESGNLYENDSLFIGGLKNTDFLPIDDGGKLVLYMKEPGWPVDVHMIVMEADHGIAPVENLIHQAEPDTRISLLFKGKN